MRKILKKYPLTIVALAAAVALSAPMAANAYTEVQYANALARTELARVTSVQSAISGGRGFVISDGPNIVLTTVNGAQGNAVYFAIGAQGGPISRTHGSVLNAKSTCHWDWPSAAVPGELKLSCWRYRS